MQEYKLLIARTVTLTTHIYVEGDSKEDAIARFEHQLESEACSQIEDAETWGEAFYYQAAKADPYSSTYEVLDAEPNE